MQDFGSSDVAPLHADHVRDADAALGRALALVRFLRERCPWDARQDPRTLRPYLLEEAHEVAEAIATGDDPGLASELGDLLLNLAFQIVLAEERDAFGPEGVVRGLEEKMRARHPHVYGDAPSPPDWEAMKAHEREPRDATDEHDPFAGIPSGLGALSRALRVQERAAAARFDWPDVSGPLDKVREETDELATLLRGLENTRRSPAPQAAPPDRPVVPAIEDEIGDLLFAVVNVARFAGAHPSNALLGATEKFASRFRAIRRLAEERGLDWSEATLDDLDELWEEVKREESSTASD